MLLCEGPHRRRAVDAVLGEGRQTGGLLRSVELAGGAHPSVRHVRCQLEGDALCERELRWEQPSAPAEG